MTFSFTTPAARAAKVLRSEYAAATGALHAANSALTDSRGTSGYLAALDHFDAAITRFRAAIDAMHTAGVAMLAV